MSQALQFQVRLRWGCIVGDGIPGTDSRWLSEDERRPFGQPRRFDTFDDADAEGKKRTPNCSYFVVAVRPEPSPEADLRAAKERLGAWLAEEPERSWNIDDGDPVDIELVQCDPVGRWIVKASGEGPTEAAALFAALERVGHR